jgi:hypothetical protein
MAIANNTSHLAIQPTTEPPFLGLTRIVEQKHQAPDSGIWRIEPQTDAHMPDF